MSPIESRIAKEIGARPAQVSAAIGLLDDGATVPFIARYRKEATGALDDTQLRTLVERLRYLRELEDRRAVVLASIEEQGKLTDALKADILEADSKTRLEDLYLPYKPKRRTRAQIAREAGLEPLALALLEDPGLDPETSAGDFVDGGKGVETVQQALEGARHILIESFSERPALVGCIRDRLWAQGQIRARVVEGKEQAGAKFSDYFDHAEALKSIPSHRLLALFRARNEGFVHLDLVLPEAEDGAAHPCVQMIASEFHIAERGRPSDAWLMQTAVAAWKTKIHLHLTLDLFGRARERAEDEAITVFGDNLKDLLLAAPAGPRVTMGLDPGLRTGVKVAVIDGTGKLLDTATVHPHAPQRKWDESIDRLAVLCRSHGVELVAIGNGTGSRETEQLVAEIGARHPQLKGLTRVLVSEAGASVYSASELAAREFPALDVSLRGAVSIARRLQDPLAELVKIDPKAIGVGQYQHDVNQVKLVRALDDRVEDCVNAVGVELNSASPPLLSRVSGLSPAVAENVVAYRDEAGPFPSRDALLGVPRLGPKAFEQAAGFLRIRDGENPLDASGVHPEAYPVVERILEAVDRPLDRVMGDAPLLRALDPEDFTCERFGVPTVADILTELEKPGRDPRPEFRTARFAEGVNALTDLKPGMVLEGVVSNVTNFGAFVDIGVHQDGLVHISHMADRFVKDPRSVVKAGEVVKVKVMDVDVDRKRIGLSMQLQEQTERPKKAAGRNRPDRRRSSPRKAQPAGPRGALGDALAEAMSRSKKK